MAYTRRGLLSNNRTLTAVALALRVGRLLGQNTRAAGLFQTEVVTAADGREIRQRCVMRPTTHQAILLDRLGLQLPEQLPIREM